MGAPTTAPARGCEIPLVDLTKQYPIGKDDHLTASDHVNLDVAAGQTVALMGTSGSGKSTLLHLIGAMDTTTSGQVMIDDVDLATLNRDELAAHRRRIGFVFQRFHLLQALTVEDNVIAPVLPYRTSFDRRARARELLKAVGLAGRETTLPSKLSGGQQQRVAIARALINEPRLLLADEPTGNLDSATGNDILDLLFGLQAETGMTMVIATHDEDVAGRCRRVVKVSDGCLVVDHRHD